MKGIKFAYILKLAGTLFLITAIVALALAGVNSITAPRIAAITAEKTQKAVDEVLPGGGELLPAGSYDDQGGMVSEVYASDKGFALKVLPMGFDNTITMMVGVDPEGNVTGIAIISHSETSGLGAVAADKGEAGQNFRGQFVGKSGELEVGTHIDAIASATITSKAVTEGVNAALKCAAGLK